MTEKIELKVVVANEHDLRRIIRDALSEGGTGGWINCAVQLNGGLIPAEVRLPYGPRPGYRFAEDGQGGLKEELIAPENIASETAATDAIHDILNEGRRG